MIYDHLQFIPYNFIALFTKYMPRNFDSRIEGAYLRFNLYFRKGLSPELYSKTLYNSKNNIVPKWCCQCRDFQAMREGCIIISDSLPDTYFYRNSPIIQISDWKDMFGIVERILADENHIRVLQQSTLNWWKDKCSEEAVANYIVCTIRNMLGLAKRTKSRILQASTSEVDGDPKVHPQQEDYWGHVNPIGFRSCYDEGKRCAETLFFDYWRQHKTEIKVARIFNTYRPRMHPSDGRVVSNFIVQALK